MRDFEYEKNNIAYDWQCTKEDGGGIKCKNYVICEAVLPLWWFDCKEKYLCSNCDIMFGDLGKTDGVLQMSGILECPICLENKECISQPRCKHSLCIDCFKRCHYGENPDDEPVFPYPDIEDEYYDDSQNAKWANYPLIEIYNTAHNKWDDERIEKYEKEENLRVCPLCRR